MGWARHLVLTMLLLLGACSMQAAIEQLSTPEDRAFAARFVDHVRSGDEAALKPQFDAALWAKSRGQLARARTLFPPGRGDTRLIGYHISTSTVNGARSQRTEYVLVTPDGSHWTRTRILTLAESGPTRVVEWSVNGSREPPDELVMMETWERALPWVWAGLAIGLVGTGSLIFWLVRRSLRKHDPWAGRS